MIVKKYYKGKALLKGESVEVAAVSVNLTDGAGNRAELRIGKKYVVSGDIIKEFFKQAKPKTVKPVKEVSHGS